MSPPLPPVVTWLRVATTQVSGGQKPTQQVSWPRVETPSEGWLETNTAGIDGQRQEWTSTWLQTKRGEKPVTTLWLPNKWAPRRTTQTKTRV